MGNNSFLTKSYESRTLTQPRICLFSMRNLQRAVFRCISYEFEDVVCQVDDVELFAPKPHSWYVAGRKVANQLARHLNLTYFNPGIKKIQLKKDYDIFFAWCQFLHDLPALNTLEGWKNRCRISVCLLSEVWATKLHRWKGHLKNLVRI